MILLTGHNGKLGTELKKYLETDDIKFDITGEIPTFDITKPVPQFNYDMVVHAAAYTYVGEAEDDAKNVFETNVYGTYNLMSKYKNVPFVYISSEYARNPLGCYALTKYLGEEIVKTHPHHLIIRTLFKPDIWPFDVAYEDQWTQGDVVSVIGKLVAEKITNWDKKTSELCYVGTGRKRMIDLARRSKPDVKPNFVTNPIIPKDYL